MIIKEEKYYSFINIYPSRIILAAMIIACLELESNG